MDVSEFEKSYELIDAGREGAPAFAALVLRCARDFVAESPLEVVAEIPVEELCREAGPRFREAVSRAGVREEDFASARNRLVLANGWQSWSFAGELARDERPRRAVLKPALNLFVDHPAESRVRELARKRRRSLLGSRRPDVVSHFFVVLRAANARLALVSMSAPAPAPASSGPSENTRTLPPVTFFVGSAFIRVAVFAEGGAFSAGETIARVALVPGADYFALKDGLAHLFGAGKRLDGLGFAGAAFGTGSRAKREPIGGFETWYNHYLDIDEELILRDAAALGGNGNLLNEMFLSNGKPVVFQIDDGWERRVGDWTPDPAKFPRGLGVLAEETREKGYIPGLWVAPFLAMPDSELVARNPGWILRGENGDPVVAGWNPGWGGDIYCLDLSLPEVEEYLVDLFDRIVEEWGFRYLKLDFLYAGMTLGRRRGGAQSDRAGLAGRGVWEDYARVLGRIMSKKTARNGEPVAWLSCGAPLESTAPFTPLARIGADTKERWDWPLLRLIGHQGRPSAKVNLAGTLARCLLDGTLFLNDPDVVFCRAHRIDLADNEKFLVGLAARMFGSQVMISDDPGEFGQEGPAERKFTRELLSLYEKLGDREFGAERFSLSNRDLYRFFSRDGQVYGIINLGDGTQTMEVESPAGDSKSALVPPRSILIFGLEAERG